MELEHEANHCDFLVASHTILLPCMLDSAPSPYRYSDLQFLKLTSFASQIVTFGGPTKISALREKESNDTHLPFIASYQDK